MSETLSLPVLPLDDSVVLPTMVVPFDTSGAEVRAAIEAAQASAAAGPADTKPRVLLVPRLDGKYSAVGTLGVIEQVGRLPSGEPAAVIRGLSRVRVGVGTVGPGAALWVQCTVADEPEPSARAHELAREYRGLAVAILQKRGAWQVVDFLQRLTDPSALADSAGYASYLTLQQRTELLETTDPEQRLQRLTGWARDQLAELDVTETIENDVREGMEKQQREFLLRQQLAAIRKGLAELDGQPASEEDDYRARIEAADLPGHVAEAALKEAAKLERSSDASPEGSWIRTWLDTVLEIPWNTRTDDAYDIAGSRQILDADHAGLTDVKDRIIEYRAVREAGSMNPVILLDEVDKLGTDYRGDPTAALLEVLDPAQNHTFRDHYLEVELDLSDVLFLATANVADTIPPALLDRMELITLDGYTEDDKVAIARQHLVPRQLSRAALSDDDVTISDEALRRIAAEYTREAGVRQLERALTRVLRKVATKLASSPEPLVVDDTTLRDYLGRPRFTPESAERTAVPGVATGLAVTGTGGDVLFIEASAMDGTTGLTLTSQLGDVMKESAQIALSYLRSHGAAHGIDTATLNRSVHLHVPAGAVPKDGPSAGVTMVTALASLASGRPVRADVGMTGEVTLNGRVLPIGGVRQKLLAAQRAGLKTVFLPERNEPDLEDVPADVLAELDVRPVADVADIVAQALE